MALRRMLSLLFLVKLLPLVISTRVAGTALSFLERLRHPQEDEVEGGDAAGSAVRPHFEHFHVLDQLFGSDGSQTHGSGHPPLLNSTRVDDFLGMISRILAAVDDSRGSVVSRQMLVDAAWEDDYPEFANFIGLVFDEVDKDRAESLSGNETQQFLDSLREYVGITLFRNDNALEAAVQSLLLVTVRQGDRGVSKEDLLGAFSHEDVPDLHTLVEALFTQVAADADGVLRGEQVREFLGLLDAALSDDDETLADGGISSGRGAEEGEA